MLDLSSPTTLAVAPPDAAAPPHLNAGRGNGSGDPFKAHLAAALDDAAQGEAAAQPPSAAARHARRDENGPARPRERKRESAPTPHTDDSTPLRTGDSRVSTRQGPAAAPEDDASGKAAKNENGADEAQAEAASASTIAITAAPVAASAAPLDNGPTAAAVAAGGPDTPACIAQSPDGRPAPTGAQAVATQKTRTVPGASEPPTGAASGASKSAAAAVPEPDPLPEADAAQPATATPAQGEQARVAAGEATVVEQRPAAATQHAPSPAAKRSPAAASPAPATQGAAGGQRRNGAPAPVVTGAASGDAASLPAAAAPPAMSSAGAVLPDGPPNGRLEAATGAASGRGHAAGASAAVDALANAIASNDDNSTPQPIDALAFRAALSRTASDIAAGANDNVAAMQVGTAVPATLLAASAAPAAAGAYNSEATAAARFDGAESARFGATPAPETSDHLVQTMRLQYQRGGGDAIVHLRPEHLGPVTVSVRVEHGAVSTRIVAENPVVAEWLRANEHTLRDGLQASGLHLNRLVVDKDGEAPQQHGRRDAPPRRTPRRMAAGQDSTFTITI